MADLPEPLVPADADLRGLKFMPLDVNRLRDSDLAATASAEGFRAAVLLWCASWHQEPAASVPNDDRMLANLSGFGRDLKGWKSVRDDALHGWVLCSDGRLYHPVVAEKALEAWEQRVEHRSSENSSADRKRREREDRKALFQALKSVGVVPGWNVSTSELRTLASQNNVTPVTDAGVTGSVTGHSNVTAKTGTGTGTGTKETTPPPTLVPTTATADGEPQPAGPGQDVERKPKPPSDPRKAEATAIIQAFDDSIAECWGENLRRPHPKPMDFDQALAWVDAGATAQFCRPVFVAANDRMKASGAEPPGTLKARDRDVQSALRDRPKEDGGADVQAGSDVATELRVWSSLANGLKPEIKARIKRDIPAGRGAADKAEALMAELKISRSHLGNRQVPDHLRVAP